MIIQTVSLFLLQAAAGVPTSSAPVPPAAAEAVRPPQPHGKAASLFSVDDYPASARGTGAHGTVVARLAVDTSGRVSGCSIVQSSGFPVLDSATCQVLTRRARYGPSIDSRGQPVPGTVDEQITWIAP